MIEDGSEGDAGVAAMVPTSKSESTNGTRILSRVLEESQGVEVDVIVSCWIGK